MSLAHLTFGLLCKKKKRETKKWAKINHYHQEHDEVTDEEMKEVPTPGENVLLLQAKWGRIEH